VFNATVLEDAKESLDKLQLSGRKMVVFDLTETIVMDSAALEWLLDLDDSCGTLGGGVRIAHGNELCREILHVTGMDERVSVFPDLTAALGSFSK
jgi:anti-anti-sigma regulatory factor